MKVLYFIDSLVPSGAERSLLALAPYYIDAGVKLEVAYLHDRPGLQGEFERLHVPLFCIDGIGGRLGWMRRARSLIADRRPSLVHTTLFEADLAGRFAARSLRTPVVSSLVNAMYGPEQLGDPNVSRFKLRLAQASDVTSARFVLRFHAISRYVADVMSGRLLIPGERIDVIPRGRDVNGLGTRTRERRERARSRVGLGRDVPLILSVARQEYQKGLSTGLEAFTRVLARFPDARYLIAGREGNATAELHALVDRLGIAGSVRFLGSRDDVPDLMAAADVFVIPSLFEGLGGTAIEAMALQLPIVTSDLPPIREVVGETGARFVPSGDPDALARETLLLLQAPEEARRRAEVGRRRFLEHFAIEGAAKKMVEFYERSLTTGAARGGTAVTPNGSGPGTIPPASGRTRQGAPRRGAGARPTRVLYVIDSLVPGGAEMSLASMAPHLVGGGVDLTVAYLADHRGLQEELERAGATLCNLAGRGGRSGNVSRVARLAREQEPDLIHTTLFEADLAGRLASLLTRTPVVSTLPAAMYDWEHVHDPSLRAWRVHAAHAADLATAQRVRRFHAVSRHVADSMSRQLLIPRSRIDVIPRGRDPRTLGKRTDARRSTARARLGIDGNTPVVVAAARHEHKKGLDVLFEAFARVRDTLPEARLVVAGREGTQTPRLLELARTLMLGDSVRFLGARDDVAELLTAADVFVLPSVSEGFPGTLLEAMALEAPIVSTDLPSTREVLGSEASARLVAVRRPDLLALALVEALNDRDDAAARARIAHTRFLEEFSIERVAERILRFYTAALER